MRRVVAGCLAVAMTLLGARAHAGKSKGPHYDPDKPVPAGYHVEDRSNAALAIVGAGLLVTGTAVVVYGIKQQNDERRLYEERRAADPRFEDGGYSSGLTPTILTGVIVATAGVPLLIVGLVTKRTVLVRDSLVITPVATQSFGGLAVAATF